MSDTLPPESRVGRAALAASEPDRLAAFYRDVVGLAVHSGNEDRVTLGAGGDDLVVLDHTDAGARPAASAGLFHLAVRVPSRAALGDALRRRREWGLDGASDHGGSEALYLSDPEGNGVEIYRDRPRREWPTDGDRVAMVTEPLDREGVAAAAAGADGVPPETDVGNVHLEVTDLAAARGFWVDALGLRVRQEWDGALFLAAGDYHHHVGLNTWNRRTPPVEGQGVEWVELLVPGDAVAAARSRLERAGFGTREAEEGVAVEDPDGIGLRLRALR